MRFILLAVGEEAATDVIESGAAFLFVTFLGSDSVLHKHASKLRGMFGPYPASAATKACRIVNQLHDWLPSSELEQIVAKAQPSSAEDSSDAPEFGQNIKFNFWEKSREEFEWLNTEPETNAFDEFSMKYVSPAPAAAASSKTPEEKVGGKWLRLKVEESFGGTETGLGLSVTDLCSQIFDVLSSSKSDDELQNEVSVTHFVGLHRGRISDCFICLSVLRIAGI